jgi:two-component system, NarL family, response regulator NreC
MRILIADDNQAVRRGVAGIISRQGPWEICGEAADGTEALQKAQELHPDLILLDMSMPGMDGIQVTRRLHETLPEIKVIIMSHHDPAQILPSILQAGALACIDKSRITAELVPAIKTIGNS